MTKKPIDLLAIGDVAINLYLKVEGEEVSETGDPIHPKICFYHGSKIPVKSVSTNIGGNAVNVSVGATLLGLNSAIYAETGDDEYSDRIIRELEEQNIDTEFIIRNKGSQTGIHPVIVYGGERTIFSHHEIRPYKLLKWPTPKWIYYTSVSPGFEQFQHDLADYLTKNLSVGMAFNPGTFHMKKGLDGIRDILQVTHVLFLNGEETNALVGTGTLEEQHIKLQHLGPKLTVITQGNKGASGFDGKTFIQIKPYAMDEPVMDKTGAGDSFAATFMSALFYKKSLYEALVWGAINSSCVIRVIGATHGLKTKSELEKLYSKLPIKSQIVTEKAISG